MDHLGPASVRQLVVAGYWIKPRHLSCTIYLAECANLTVRGLWVRIHHSNDGYDYGTHDLFAIKICINIIFCLVYLMETLLHDVVFDSYMSYKRLSSLHIDILISRMIETTH